MPKHALPSVLISNFQAGNDRFFGLRGDPTDCSSYLKKLSTAISYRCNAQSVPEIDSNLGMKTLSCRYHVFCGVKGMRQGRNFFEKNMDVHCIGQVSKIMNANL